MNKKWHWDSNPCDYDVNEDQPWLVDDNGNQVLWGEIHCDLNDNAYLIAAAPELLEALEHIVEYWNRDRNDNAMHDALWHIIETAEQAIAKAKGE